MNLPQPPQPQQPPKQGAKPAGLPGTVAGMDAGAEPTGTYSRRVPGRPVGFAPGIERHSVLPAVMPGGEPGIMPGEALIECVAINSKRPHHE